MNAVTNESGNKGTVQVTLPSDREIAMTRVFDAPRALVFDAHTKPELIKRWLGVRAGWTMLICEVDLRVGGSYRYVWSKKDGTIQMGMGGVYSEIVVPERIVSLEKFDQAWYEGECTSTISLTETGGTTTVTLSLRYDSKAVRDAVLQSPAKDGVGESYDALAGLLASSRLLSLLVCMTPHRQSGGFPPS